MRRALTLAVPAVFALLVAVPSSGPGGSHDASAAPAAAARKLVVIGVDGFAADRAEALLAAGRLPNLAALRERGGYTRLRTSNPAQSPVSWASMISGVNPGRTGIFDFLRRQDFQPSKLTFAHAEVTRREVVTPFRTAVGITIAGVLGAVAGLGLAFAIGARSPAWRKGKKLELMLSGGAAVFGLAAYAASLWVPSRAPEVRNLRGGEPFWVTLDRAGERAVVLEAPLCLPPEPMSKGSVLAGLGVPDMSGSWGTFAVWTDDPTVPRSTETAGTGWFVDPRADRFELVIGGPDDPFLSPERSSDTQRRELVEKHLREISLEWSRVERRTSETKESLIGLERRLTARLPVTLRRGTDATVRLQDGTELTLRPGEWTDLLPVRFRASPLVTLHGRVRLLLQDAGGKAAEGTPGTPFRLFVGQVQWDAARLPPNVPLSEPRTFAPELAEAIGPFETIGWPEQTNSVKDDFLSDRAFVQHTDLVFAQRRKRFLDRLRRKDFSLLFTLFSEPDRVQHALYRHADPESPTHDPVAAREFGGEIDRSYEEIDKLVGEAVALAGDDTDVLVVSDHGFAPFRTGVNLNVFLRVRGWQTAKEGDTERGVADLAKSDFFSNLDWRSTKAYAFGLGGIFLNLAGREPQGSVPMDQADAVLEGISKDLLALRDEKGNPVVKAVYRGSDLFRGERAAEAPDLVVGFHRGFRVSWQSTVGGKKEDVLSPNLFRWSGDHCSVDPSIVPGVFFSSRPLADGIGSGATPGAEPGVEDVAPTILTLFGITPRGLDGRPILK